MIQRVFRCKQLETVVTNGWKGVSRCEEIQPVVRLTFTIPLT